MDVKQQSKMRKPKNYGGWEERKTIGTGGFGVVILFHNEEENRSIALKKCRVVQEMQQKHKERWSMEIDIMLRLYHPNIIQALKVPEPLLALQETPEVPMLAMEFCSEGDLRNFINKPENSCGLREKHVRDLTRDVASGIEYLHSNKIIHRDLKPENIVLQKTDDGKIIHKLIDLGYAKDMEHGSVCTSFVGTMQYLAPELFKATAYRATVDYWSFGTLVFECITGFRPFLHSQPPLRWQNEVERKDYKDIHAYINEKGSISLSQSLPTPNHLCRPSQQYFEHWLRMMLVWNAKDRGGGLSQNKRHRCFEYLDQIINTRILYILSVHTNELLTIPIQDKQKPLSVYLNLVATESGIPVEEQELLFASGMSPDANKPVEFSWTDPITSDSEESFLYLFRKDGQPLESLAQWRSNQRSLPPLVAEMLGEQGVLMIYLEQRKVWSHALYFVKGVQKDYERLLEAEKAGMMCLLRMHSSFDKTKKQLTSDAESLQAKIQFFFESYDYDLKAYEEQAKTGLSSKKMLMRWDGTKKEIEEFEKLIKEAKHLEQQWIAINARVLELNRSPYARKKETQNVDPELSQVVDECMNLYTKLRQMPYEQRNKAQDNRGMVQVVMKCLSTYERAISNLHAHFSTIAKCKSDLVGFLPRCESVVQRIRSAISITSQRQKMRQKDIWYLITVALHLSRNSPSPSEKPEMSPLPNLNLRADQPDGNTSLSQPSSSNDPEAASYPSSMFIETAMQMSSMVLTENNNHKRQLSSIMESLHIPSSNESNWSFLDEPHTTTNKKYKQQSTLHTEHFHGDANQAVLRGANFDNLESNRKAAPSRQPTQKYNQELPDHLYNEESTVPNIHEQLSHSTITSANVKQNIAPPARFDH